ncbi:hypothetical protein [Sphingomonas turrisvirgatae]|uniref:DUF4350 domain-containing protein n=1 Tax=Sphingomonas turrisvirgatae TaxID=1888892 RepID=A0A1E3M020_9SPHN|nr:hypothetical protein [Sphingomonas turrisvirgatae]ODP39417.1 hypothetical protein BFL28_10060 [Sphingomonas turrisvirgatae]
MSEASPFRRRTVLILIGVGLVAMLGFLLTATYGDRFDRPRSNAPSPTSRYATGFQALFQLIEQAAGSAWLSGDSEDRGEGLLVLLPNLRTQPDELRAAMGGHEGPTLVVLPKWLTAPQRLRRDREDRHGMVPPAAIQRLMSALTQVEPHQEDGSTRLRYPSGLALKPFATSEPIQAIAGKDLVGLIEAPDGAAVLAEIKGTNVYVLADPDLLNNVGLASGQNAQAAIALLRALDPDHPGEVAFDIMLPHGAGGRNMGQLLFEPPFVGVTIALLAAALLAGVATFSRFGPPRREPRALAFGKRALIENIVSLARRAGRTREGGGAFADAVRDWAARRLALPRTLQGEALDAHLDTLHTATPYAATAQKVRDANSEPDLLRAAQQLDDWRKEVKA